MTKSKLINRYVEEIAFSDIFKRQMRFIVGPRQCGKTTIAKKKLDSLNCGKFYYNWDKKEVRDRYRKEESFLETDLLQNNKLAKYWVCLDEIHKMPKWKNILKDFFDTYEEKINFIVIGSAKLDLIRRAGDSLAGRYFLFRLNPLILSELSGRKAKDILPEHTAQNYLEKLLSNNKYEQNIMLDLLRFSGFPEPLLSANSLFAKKWHSNYLERIVKEDLRDISHIHQLEKVMDLLFLLPDKIAAPLSINSLRNDLELNFNTVKNYINYLELGYVIFSIAPYQKTKSRLVKKEKKAYFYDWAMVEDEAKRFENYIAVELKARIDLWNDMLEDNYELMYVRTKDGTETDFLITKNRKPYFLCEVKLSNDTIARHHFKHVRMLGDVPFIQIVKESNILRVKTENFYIASASRFLV